MSENGVMRYGPEKLDVPEAFALFARPILDNDALYEDPDSLDDAMSKAQAYWDLAHVPANNLEAQIQIIAAQRSSKHESAAQIEKEALLMIERFHELFPEHKS